MIFSQWNDFRIGYGNVFLDRKPVFSHIARNMWAFGQVSDTGWYSWLKLLYAEFLQACEDSVAIAIVQVHQNYRVDESCSIVKWSISSNDSNLMHLIETRPVKGTDMCFFHKHYKDLDKHASNASLEIPLLSLHYQFLHLSCVQPYKFCHSQVQSKPIWRLQLESSALQNHGVRALLLMCEVGNGSKSSTIK